MKVRKGFVSNSSSSSFCVVGKQYNEEDYEKIFNDLDWESPIYGVRITEYDPYTVGLDINKIKLVRINNIDNVVSYYLNNNICLKKKGNSYCILDLKLNKIIISRKIDYTNIKDEEVFIFNKKENIFGICLNYYNDEKELMIFQFKL